MRLWSLVAKAGELAAVRGPTGAVLLLRAVSVVVSAGVSARPSGTSLCLSHTHLRSVSIHRAPLYHTAFSLKLLVETMTLTVEIEAMQPLLPNESQTLIEP